jgi:hypothetical protein
MVILAKSQWQHKTTKFIFFQNHRASDNLTANPNMT